MPLLGVVAAAGLFLVALGNNGAREDVAGFQPLFWFGLVAIYAPIAFRLLSAAPSREERIALALTLGLSLFLVKVLTSPLEYVRFDELGWWRATDDLVQTGHAFQSNPINVATAGFPGLAAVTAAASQLTGLSIFHAGIVVIGAARLGLVLALFLFLERVTGSARAAGIGIGIYACNPSFLYFDAQFGYESLALMIGAALVLAAQRWSRLSRFEISPLSVGLAATMALLIAMVTVTHHMTSFAVLAFFVIWLLTTLLASRRWGWPHGDWPRGVGLPTAVLALAVGAWFVFVGGAVTIEELGGVFSRAFHSVLDLVGGSGGSKQLFSGAGESETLLGRALSVGWVVPMLAVIPLALLDMWRERERDPLRLALAAVAVLYPLTLALRLTLESSETSQRASEFVFVGLAFLGAILICRASWPRRRAAALTRETLLAGVGLTAFLGGFVIGELAATRQPGPYKVGAEDRSVTPEGLAAAGFAADRLPERSRIHIDRTNGTLLGSYGGVDPVLGKYGEISIPRVFFSEVFDRANRRVIRGQSLAYLVVDTRLSREVPLIGYYIESDEPQAYTRETPVARAALEKFNRVPEISRIYANGPIVIYDTTVLLR